MSREHHHANLSCSFCRKGQREVRKLIAGSPTVHICDECVLLCADILGEEAVGELARALAQLKVQEAESKAELERVRAELKRTESERTESERTESERTELERVLWLAQHLDAKRVAIMALHFARACDEAQDVPRPVAERARSLAKEIEGLVHR